MISILPGISPAVEYSVCVLVCVIFCKATLTCFVFSRLLSEILKQTSEDIEEIEYLTDGSWQPIRDEKERDRDRESSNTPDYPDVDICECQTLRRFLLLSDTEH